MGTDRELMPQFETEEQEAEYWDTHSPLDLAAEPKAQKVRIRGAKDRPITIRLDSESRLKLDKLAAERGIGPSTFARLILMLAIEHGLPKPVTLDELKDALEENLPQALKERAESLAKAISLGNPENPSFLLIDRSQMKDWEDLALKFIRILLAWTGIRVITPEVSEYEKLKSSLVEGRKDR